MGGALLEDDLGGDLGGDFGGGQMMGAGMAPAGQMAYMGAPAIPEAPYSLWNVLLLSVCLLILTLTGMMMYDMLRNMWSWNAPYTVNSSIMDLIMGMFGG